MGYALVPAIRESQERPLAPGEWATYATDLSRLTVACPRCGQCHSVTSDELNEAGGFRKKRLCVCGFIFHERVVVLGWNARTELVK